MGKIKKSKVKTITGKVQGVRGHNKNYAFVIPDNKDEQDVFIPVRKLKGAMHNDDVIVEVSYNKATDRSSGEVIEILKRNTHTLIGSYQKNEKFGFIVPVDSRYPDLYIANRLDDYSNGDIVNVEIIKYVNKSNRHHTARIIEKLGREDDKGIDILSVAKDYGLPMEFPENVLEFAENIPDEIESREYLRRLDLRNEKIVTIDGEDAKDLDDAISIFKDDNGNFILGVHIADVTHYVTDKSPLDKEAFKRGTSVYLVDRVIPMLPKKLSNGICSLNPNVDRLTLSCIMTIDNHGKVIKSKVKETIINTNERMTYTNVTKILERSDKEIVKRYEYLIPEFEMMKELCLILRNKRIKRGALDFDFPEPKIILDDNGVPIDIYPYPREISHKIIEEFMLIANETIAEKYCEDNIPFVYRIHEDPDEEKLDSFKEYISLLGYKFDDKGSLHNQLQSILKIIEGADDEKAVSSLLLRSLMKAKYSNQCNIHFGLAAEYYCHFTSPIRRYPDLQIHRIIKETLKGKLSENKKDKLEKRVEIVSINSNEREMLADEVEKDVDDMKKAEYMSYHIDEVFEGNVSSVTEFGLFIVLSNTVEGVISITSLKDDEYSYDKKNKILYGINTKRIFKLGQPIKVKCISSNIETRVINFEVVDSE